MRQRFNKVINRWSLGIVAIVAVVMLAIVWTIPSEAAQEGVFTYTVSNGGATITACDTSASGQLVIPERLGGYPVTGIDEYAFKGCTGLTSIDIPTKLKSVGLGAFSGCSGLTDVNITDLKAWSEIEFDSYSANPCYYSKKLSLNGSEITQLVIPEGVTRIGKAAFANCRGITSVSIPEGVTSIGEHAFYDCSAVTNISVPSSLTDMGFMAFGSCRRLESISIPEGVTSISAYAFYQCTWLKDISLPSSLTSISRCAFSECGINNINIPEGVTFIGDSAFENSGLTSISIPSGVTNIEEKTFYGCSRLTSVSIPEGVTSIGEQAFEGCSSMTSISIPSSVRSIERRSFYDCSGLMSISIPEGVTSISESTFYGCSGLTNINLPSSLMSIEEFAFASCSGLTNMNIPENVTSIGKRAFSFCSGLTSINIPEGVTFISGGAFYCCSELTNINIPEGITAIYPTTFFKCSGLTSINIPEGVTTIYDQAFQGCSGLTSVNIPPSVTSVGVRAFRGCSGLTSINISPNVTSIGTKAFSGCSGLTSVNIPSSVTSIGAEAFSECDNLILMVSNAYTKSYAVENNIPYVLGITGISIKKLPDKVEYCVSEDFVDDGLIVTAHYYDDTSEEITSGYTVSGFDSSKPGTCKITIEYLDKTTFFDVTILGEEEDFPELSIFSATLQLENDISVSFKAKTEIIDEIYTDVYIIVTQELENGKTRSETIQGVLSEDGLYYEFKYSSLNAKEVGDLMDITIYGYRNGTLITGKTVEDYSVMTYCLRQLEKSASELEMTETRMTAFRTLLVDLVNYASEAQLYFGYKTDALASSQLSAEQKSYASADSAIEGMASITNANHEMIDNPTVTWKSVALLLGAKTTLRLKVTYAGNVENVKLYAKVGNAKFFEVTEHEKIGEGSYYFYFDDMNAQEFSKSIDFYFVEKNTVISNTLRYSVESYATKKSDDVSVGGVVSALMKYGKAAKAYVETQ